MTSCTSSPAPALALDQGSVCGSKSHESLSLHRRLLGSHMSTSRPAADQLCCIPGMSLSPHKSQHSHSPPHSAAVAPVRGLSPTSSLCPHGAAFFAINPLSTGKVSSMGQQSPLGAPFRSRRERAVSYRRGSCHAGEGRIVPGRTLPSLRSSRRRASRSCFLSTPSMSMLPPRLRSSRRQPSRPYRLMHP